MTFLAGLRRTLAVALGTAGAAAGVLSGTTDHVQVCRDVLASVGNTAVVRTCGPIQITDAASVAFVLLELILWAPDLSEAEFFGLCGPPFFGPSRLRV